MKVNKKQNMNGKSNKNRIPWRFLLPAAIFLSAAFILILLFAFLPKDWLSGWQNTAASEVSQAESIPIIPDMEKTYVAEPQRIYYTGNTEDPFADVHEQEAYMRSVRIVTKYGESINDERMTITRQAEKYKAESDSRIIICNGENVYFDYGTQKLIAENDHTLYYKEIGITSLDDVREMMRDKENYQTSYQISADSRIVTVNITDTANDLHMEFDISVESGLVTAERFMTGGSVYRTILTESLDISVQLSDNYFDIPIE